MTLDEALEWADTFGSMQTSPPDGDAPALMALAAEVRRRSLPTPAPGQCPMCGEYSMAARAHQGLYGVKVEL